MINLPTTLEEIQKLIDDQVQEHIHLDYKDSRSLRRQDKQTTEIAKDVSAFANSDGGIIIYGVVEDQKKHLPVKFDDGVSDPAITREWLENIIRSHTTPRIDDLKIIPISLSNGNSIFVVQVPKSYRAPHQDLYTKKYYKRFNFSSYAMEDYEINDVRTRRRIIFPLLNVDVEIKQGVAVFLTVSNPGDLPAQNVKFEFSEKLTWHGNRPAPALFANGAEYFPPGKTFKFFYHSFQTIMAEGSTIPSRFDVTVSYFHPDLGQRMTEVFPIDLTDYRHSSVDRSELYEHGQLLREALDKMTAQLGQLNSRLDRMSSVSGATGLDLSVSTLRNLRHLLAHDNQWEKLNPIDYEPRVFQEVLEVDTEMAFKLYNFFLGAFAIS